MHQTYRLVYDAGEEQKRSRKTLVSLRIRMEYITLDTRCQSLLNELLCPS